MLDHEDATPVTTYELRFEGDVDADVLAAFDSVHMSTDGTSLTICARVPDAEALQGLIAAGQQLGLQVVTVRPLGR